VFNYLDFNYLFIIIKKTYHSCWFLENNFKQKEKMNIRSF